MPIEIKLTMLLLLLQLTKALPQCSELDYWNFDCPLNGMNFTEGIPENATYSLDCPETGQFPIECTPRVQCEGKVIRYVKCIPSTGKSGGTALLLSVLLGWLGVDRFYLGYPTIGLFKMFTGGFFGLGWYLDIFLIALQIVTPARGGAYRNIADRTVIRVRLPNALYF